MTDFIEKLDGVVDAFDALGAAIKSEQSTNIVAAVAELTASAAALASAFNIENAATMLAPTEI